jgi:hypothetical protein
VREERERTTLKEKPSRVNRVAAETGADPI